MWKSFDQVNFLLLTYCHYHVFLHHQCHHYSDHGHDHSDQGLDHHNNDDDQHKYDDSYVKIIWSSHFIDVNLLSLSYFFASSVSSL